MCQRSGGRRDRPSSSDRCLDREIAGDKFRRLLARDVTCHRPGVQNRHELIEVEAVALGKMHGFGEARNE